MKISILFSISKIDHQNDKWKLIINDLNQKMWLWCLWILINQNNWFDCCYILTENLCMLYVYLKCGITNRKNPSYNVKQKNHE